MFVYIISIYKRNITYFVLVILVFNGSFRILHLEPKSSRRNCIQEICTLAVIHIDIIRRLKIYYLFNNIILRTLNKGILLDFGGTDIPHIAAQKLR